MQGLRAPGPVCACRGAPGRALRAQPPAQHRTRDGRFARNRSRPHKKALVAPPVLPWLRPGKAPEKRRKSGGKRLNSMKYGRL